MGRKKTPGLKKRGQIWHIDKWVCGCRIQESTRTNSLEEAECYLNQRIQEIREEKMYGVRPKYTFKEAAVKYLAENQHKACIQTEAHSLQLLCTHIGNRSLDTIHNGALLNFIEARKTSGVKNRTVNTGLQVVRQILNLAANEWLDENGLTWLAQAPKIKLLRQSDARRPYPLSWEEQEALFSELPAYLRDMALFKVNTGCREQEVCQLKWEWEVAVPEFNTSVFIIPAGKVKNREERLVVLNQIAIEVIDKQRGKHPAYVFVHRHRGYLRPMYQMNTKSWQSARRRANVPVRVHDLKHTFGRRLRAAGVSFEDRQDLLGHKSGRITTHYSAAELGNLIAAANAVCSDNCRGAKVTLLERRRVLHGSTHAKSLQSQNVVKLRLVK